MEKWKSAGGVVLPHTGDLDKVYIVKPANDYGPWSFPKGRVDKGESEPNTALREVEEEAGLKARIIPGADLGTGTGSYSVTRYYLMRASGTPGPHDDETEEVLLVTFDEAREIFKSDGNHRDIMILDRAIAWINDNMDVLTGVDSGDIKEQLVIKTLTSMLSGRPYNVHLRLTLSEINDIRESLTKKNPHLNEVVKLASRILR